MTGTTGSAEVITANIVSIQKIIWPGITTAGHRVELTDTDGNVIFQYAADTPGTAGTPTYESTFPTPHSCVGLKVTDMDSGTLLIYLVTKGI